MTWRGLFSAVAGQLAEAGCDDPAFDARCLLEDIGGLPRGCLEAHFTEAVPEASAAAVHRAADERAAGRPLQYILGSWDFLDMTLSVGEGVLIPRPDTELLCEIAAAWLNKQPAGEKQVLDLCAGTGCVGLGIAGLCPDAVVTAVELSPEALTYLEENRRRYPARRVTPVRADVLADADKFPGGFAALVSNPPYIPSADLSGLMREVQHEPRMALDGGDGLRFYRAIVQDWLLKLRAGGFCAVEVGIGQAEGVAALFAQSGLRAVEIHPDAAGIGRVVSGEK